LRLHSKAAQVLHEHFKADVFSEDWGFATVTLCELSNREVGWSGQEDQ
jgi:hypothetical protein